MRETGCRDIGGHAHKSERFVLGLRSLVLLFCLAYYIVTSHFVYTYIYIYNKKSAATSLFGKEAVVCVPPCSESVEEVAGRLSDVHKRNKIYSNPTRTSQVLPQFRAASLSDRVGPRGVVGESTPPPQWAGPLSGPWRRPGPCGWPPWHLPGWRSCPPWAAGTLGAGPRCARCSRSGNRWCPC